MVGPAAAAAMMSPSAQSSSAQLGQQAPKTPEMGGQVNPLALLNLQYQSNLANLIKLQQANADGQGVGAGSPGKGNNGLASPLLGNLSEAQKLALLASSRNPSVSNSAQDMARNSQVASAASALRDVW